MIATISGTVSTTTQQTIIIQYHGIGFELSVAHPYSYQPQQSVTLYTHLHWNQEQGPSLFGFQSELEKATFLLIISCSGVGPKMALTILQQLDPAIFLQAIHEHNIDTLSSIHGIGTKKAEQLAVTLKHKVDKLLQQHPQLATTSLGVFKDLTDTLNSLNYSSIEIKSVTNYLKETSIDINIPFDQLLRKALIFLAKK